MENPRISKITDEGSLHKYRTEIPNTIIRGIKSHGLSIHAKWLYVYFKSVCGDGTECYRTTSTIAEESGLSRTMVSTAKRELAAKGLIAIKKSKNPNRQADHVRIKDIWDANMQEFCVPLANALNQERDKEIQGNDEGSVPLANADPISVPLANADPHQRSISERSVPLANTGVLLANQRRSQEEDPLKNKTREGSAHAQAQDLYNSRTHAGDKERTISTTVEVDDTIVAYGFLGPRGGHTPPPNFTPTEALRALAAKDAPNVDLDLMTKMFRATYFPRAVLDWGQRWYKYALEEEARAGASRNGQRTAPAVSKPSYIESKRTERDNERNRFLGGAHARPHRSPDVLDRDGKVIDGVEYRSYN